MRNMNGARKKVQTHTADTSKGIVVVARRELADIFDDVIKICCLHLIMLRECECVLHHFENCDIACACSGFEKVKRHEFFLSFPCATPSFRFAITYDDARKHHPKLIFANTFHLVFPFALPRERSHPIAEHFPEEHTFHVFTCARKLFGYTIVVVVSFSLRASSLFHSSFRFVSYKHFLLFFISSASSCSVSKANSLSLSLLQHI